MSRSWADRGTDKYWLAATLVAALVVGVVMSKWVLAMWELQNDEVAFRTLATSLVDQFPQSLWEHYARGTQRFNVWLLAGSIEVFGAPRGFIVARWTELLVFVSTAAPVWLLARRAGATCAWSSVVALLAILVPWAVLTGTFLTEPIAYPVSAWAVLAIWCVADRGGTRSYAWLAIAMSAAVLARTGLLVLGGAAVMAVFLTEGRILIGERRQGLRRALSAAAQRQRWGLVALCFGLVVIAVVGFRGLTEQIAGGWYSNTSLRLDGFRMGAEFLLARVGSGLSFVPLIAAGGFVLCQSARPSGRPQLALAAAVIGVSFVMVATLATSAPEERYVVYLAPPVLAALAVAGSRRGTPWWSVLGGGAVVALAVTSSTWGTTYGLYGYLFFPAETFHARVARLGIPARIGIDVSPEIASLLVVVAATLAAVVLVSPRLHIPERSRQLVVGLIIGGLLIAAAVQTFHTFESFGNAGGGSDVTQRAWVDEYSKGRQVGVWNALAPPAGGDIRPILREIFYYNLSVSRLFFVRGEDQPLAYLSPQFEELVPNQDGFITAHGMPELFLVERDQSFAPLRSTVIRSQPGGPFDLVRASRPVSLKWWLAGLPSDGWLAPGATARLAIYPRINDPACLKLQIIGSFVGVSKVTVRGLSRSVSRVIPTSKQVDLLIPVRGRGRPNVVRVSGSGVAAELTPERDGLLNILPVGFAACRAH